MSDLSGSERRKLEKLLGMGGGYVLNFSDRTFGDFFDEYRVEIDAERPIGCVPSGMWMAIMSWGGSLAG